MALRFAEEIVLLLLNDDDGKFAQVPAWSLNCALAGGVLMDLALENRIDSDLEKLVLLDAAPVGDSLLDETLADIEAGGGATLASGCSALRTAAWLSAMRPSHDW